jgi:anaerobic selenocysteine-containing dehydrogenase
LVVYNSNPAAIAPHQSKVLAGLRRSDLFTVVLEHFRTDTADFADILLPATTFLEHTDLYLAYGHYYLQLARPALRAAGEARSNVEIFRELAHRMNFEDECFNDTEDDMMRCLLDSSSPYLSGITLEQLHRDNCVRLNTGARPFLPFAAGGFRTKSGKFEIEASLLRYVPPVESRFGDGEVRQQFPFELISHKNDDSLNSTFGHREDVDRQTAKLAIHPDDAAPRRIADGTRVRVFNSRGSCSFVAKLSYDVQPGVLQARTMRWNRSGAGKRGVNQLTSERLTDLGGGPTFYSCLVQVAPE